MRFAINDNKIKKGRRSYFTATLGKFVPVVGIVAIFSGCSSLNRDYDTPSVKLPEAFQYQSINEQPNELSGLTQAGLTHWWKKFQNSELNWLVDIALANNADLKIASQKVLQASARAVQEESGRYPLVTAPLEYKSDSPITIGTVPKGSTGSDWTTYSASLRGDWQPDVWGEFSSASNAANLMVWKTLFDYDRGRQLLVEEVVSAYIEYLSLNDKLESSLFTEEMITNVLDSIQQRYEKGDATAIELERQRAAVYTTRTLLPTIRLQKQLVKNRIARLTGMLPHQFDLTDKGLQTMVYHNIKPSIPSSLLTARADIRAVEAELLAMDANIDQARAQMMPAFNITAQVGYGGLKMEELFEPHTFFWRFLANTVITVFDHGKREQQVKFSEAVYTEKLEEYYRTIYDAVVEVESALASIDYGKDKSDLQDIAAQASKKAWGYMDEIFRLTLVDYFAMLDTIRTYQRDLLNKYDYNMEKYMGLVKLYSVLGGASTPRQALPGEGARPKQTNTIESVFQEDLTQYWSTVQFAKPDEANALDWHVAISNIYTRDSAEAFWRVLHQLYSQDIDGHVLRAEPLQRTADQQGQVIDWFDLSVREFADQQQAKTFCEKLMQKNLRCEVSSEQSAGPFYQLPWD
jgi:multidrug efflux system outer membrane protein